MKRILVLAALLLATPSVAMAQPSTNSQTEQELRRIIQEMFASAVRGDKSGLVRYLADTYIETDENGRVTTKPKILENFQGPPASVKPAFDIEEFQVREYGETAVVSYRGVFRGEANGQKFSATYRSTETWIRRDGNWQMVAEHTSHIPLERVAARVDPKVYDAYVGQYEIAPGIVLTISREGDRLMGQATGEKTKTELVPENETTFFVKGETNKTVFVKDEKGQVTHILLHSPDGQEIKAKKTK